MVNDLVGESGAVGRVFTLYVGGHDGPALLLDPRVVDAMRHSGLSKDEGVPEPLPEPAAG